MFFLKSFHFLILLAFSFYSNTFCGYGNNPPEAKATKIDKFIDLNKVEIMSDDNQFCYILIKENPETKVDDVSIKVDSVILENDKFKNVTKTLKLNDDILNNLKIIKVAKDCYILFVNDKVNNKFYYLNEQYSSDKLLLTNDNILNMSKINESIESLNKTDVNFIFNIKDIKGLKILGEPVKFKLK